MKKSNEGKKPKRGRRAENQITIVKLAAALQQFAGNISAVAKKFGATRQTIYYHIGNNEELKQLCHDSREAIIDWAEYGLLLAVQRGEPWAIRFTLATIGRSRGYGEKVETADGKTEYRPIQFVEVSLTESSSPPEKPPIIIVDQTPDALPSPEVQQ